MNQLAYSRRLRLGAHPWTCRLSVLTLLGAISCTAGVKATGTGTAGSGGAATGSGGKAGTGSGNTTGQGNTGGDITGAGGGTTNPDASSCQQKEVMFTATNPTVFILVDRSGSEFTTATTGTFFDLRTAVEQVISSTVGGSSLDSQVRFGVGSFVGDHASGSCMLNYQSVAIALNNAAAITAAYSGWGPLLPYGTAKADTPAVEAIPMVKAALQADTGTGQKYMMIVTDSETDFCDDGNALCPADAVTYMIQDLYNSTPSIGTLVIGLPTLVSPISTAVLQNFANAGAGQAVAVPTGSGAATATDVYYQCTGMTNGGADSWSSLFTAAGRTGMTSLATYSTTGGTATVYTPAAGGAQALADQISMALAGVRSCTFELPGFTIDTTDPTQLNGADIYIVTSSGSHVMLPYDSTNTNGWDMTTPTELQLYGPACDQLRDPSTTDIKFNFPCKIVICIDKCNN